MSDNLLTDISVLSGVTGATGASVTPEKIIPRNKIKIKSLVTFPPRKDPITNQDQNTLWIEKIKVFHHTYLNFLPYLNN